jgi:photosystem II stability/assembly factor-like uncharacterized protein
MTQNTLLRSTGFLLLGFLSSFLFAQTDRPHPSPADVASAPRWAQQMYGERPNVFAVDSAFLSWRKSHPAADTYHTRFYKHWRRGVGSYLSAEGFWSPPSPQEDDAYFRQWLDLRQGPDKRSTPVWENLGPFQTWREGNAQEVSWQVNVYCLDQSLSDPKTLYAGTENGAVFKSTDGAESWAPLTNDLNMRDIRAVKVHPTDPLTAWFAEGNNVYKTTNGGTSWALVFSKNNLNVNDISVNPADPAVMLLAAESGLYRSTDGGMTWSQLFTQKCWDLEIKTDDPNTVFLLKTNTATRLCEFFKSSDKGATWVQKTAGWIDPAANSTADNTDNGARLAVTNADPNRLYAVLIGNYNDGVNDNNYLGVYRSNDSGESWTLPNANASGGPGGPYAGNHACLVTFWFNDQQKYPNAGSEYNQGFYNLALDASDTNPNALLVGFLNLFKSEDGGATFQQWGGYGGGPGWQHPDIQDIDINGTDVWVSSDGGIDKYLGGFGAHSAKNRGLAGSDFWGFDGGWNEDVMTGGRYHNGNTATIFETYPDGEFIRLGGAEETTGYVHPAGGYRVMHSDISPKILPATVTGSVSSFTFSQYPNEGYAGNNENSSEIEPDPRCYNHLYMGLENRLEKSTDGGLSWEVLHTFGSNVANIVTGIEVSRSNPGVIYCVQNVGSVAYLWKSTDGGQTFSTTTNPPGLANGAFIALSAEDENKIWLAWNRGGTSGNKVFESTDGGTSWTNLSTSTLDGHFTEQLLHIGGTDDGLYLATNLGVFYRSDSETDWMPCSGGLPAKAAINRLVPFYAKGKVRIATYGRGIWQADFVENPAQPIVQPTVDKLEALCQRDTFFFDDYSMVNHTGATWAWSFEPAPLWVSGLNVRNPQVVFGQTGTYTATMTLNGSFSQKISVTVGASCAPENVPGNALSLDATTGYAAANGNLNLNTNTFTVTAWIKASASQNAWAPFVFARGGTTTLGIGFGDNLNLRYHWDGGGWSWDSGLPVEPDTWAHVALVISPDNAKIYLNGEAATHNQAKNPEAFDTPLLIGWDPNSTSRRFNGLIDEVTVWNKSLSQEELRELMHLTKVPANSPGVVAYYQMNETGGQIMDRVGVRHASLVGNAARTTSTAPVGGGVSARLTVDAPGSYTFGSTGVTMEFPAGGIVPGGEVVVSRLNLAPDQLPNASPHSSAYWVVNNFGLELFFDELTSIRFDEYGDIPTGSNPANYFLYKRSSFADGDTWGDAIDQGDEVSAGGNGSVKFSEGNGITSFSQFIVMQETALPVEWKDFHAALQPEGSVRLYWTVQQGADVSHFVLEKSADGVDFQAFGKISARRQSGIFTYQAKDVSPVRGINFYRLRQIDLSGETTLSAVRTVVLNALPSGWVVFPNPLPKEQVLIIETASAEAYRFRLYNLQGKVILEKTCRGNASLTDLNLLPGAYGYEVISSERRVTGKLIVKD